jgi:energy-coupling factor transporter ATP-binding protein EcfA2
MDTHHARPVPEQVRGRAEDFVGRQWVLGEVVEWSEHRPERYLLILGEPGIGKTALAAWLAGIGPAPGGPAAERLAALRQGWAAVHFCIARGQRGTVNAGGFSRSLAEQLAQRYDSFATAAIERIAPEVNISLVARENWGTMIGAEIGRLIIADRDAEDVYNRVVREPLQHLASVEAGLTVPILVDALDEGHTGQEPDIVTLIAGSGDFPPGVRFVPLLPGGSGS